MENKHWLKKESKFAIFNVIKRFLYQTMVCKHTYLTETRKEDLETVINGKVDKYIYHRVCDECGATVSVRRV